MSSYGKAHSVVVVLLASLPLVIKTYFWSSNQIFSLPLCLLHLFAILYLRRFLEYIENHHCWSECQAIQPPPSHPSRLVCVYRIMNYFPLDIYTSFMISLMLFPLYLNCVSEPPISDIYTCLNFHCTWMFNFSVVSLILADFSWIMIFLVFRIS